MLAKYQPIIESFPCNLNIQFFTYNDFNFQKSLGKGAFGEVYESQWKHIKIVVKVLKWSGSIFFHYEGGRKSFILKVHTLGSIQHINVVRLLGYYIEGLKCMLVYEYMSNSSLDK
jgi:serine/threonine protein kinase